MLQMVIDAAWLAMHLPRALKKASSPPAGAQELLGTNHDTRAVATGRGRAGPARSMSPAAQTGEGRVATARALANLQPSADGLDKPPNIDH